MKKIISLFLISLFLTACSTSDEEKSTRFMEKGNTLFAEGNYTKAVLEYKNVLQVDPANVTAHLKLGEIYLKLDDPRNAYFAYSRAQALDPENTEAQLKLASFSFLMKKFDDARNKVDAVLKKDPLNTDALMLMAGLHMQDKKLDEAEFLLRRVIRQNEKEPRAYLTLSTIMISQGKLTEAEQLLEKAVAVDTTSTQSKLGLFQLYEQQGNNEKAGVYINDLISQYPDDVNVLLAAGGYHVRHRQFDQAEQIFSSTLEKHPDNQRAFNALVAFYDSTDRKQESLTLYRKAHEASPEDDPLTLELAKRTMHSGDNEAAAGYLKTLLEKQPDNQEARLLEAERLIANKEFEAAIAYLDQLLKDLPPAFAEANYRKAVAWLALRKTEPARQVLETVLSSRPDHEQSRNLLSKLYLGLRDFQSAVNLGEKILAREPGNVEALQMVGASAILLNQLEKARTAFEKMIEVAPQNPNGFQALGLLQLKENELDKAKSSFEQTLELAPDRLDALQKLVLLHLSVKRSDLALAVCDTALVRNQNNPSILAGIELLRGQIFQSRKELDKASGAYSSAIRTAPDQQEGYFLLAKLNIERYGEQKAIETLEAQIAANPDQPAGHLIVANIYDLLKQHNLAEPHYRRLLELRPGFIPAINNLAYVLAEQEKDLNEAMQLAKQALEKLPDNVQVLDTLGWVQVKAGQFDEAILNLQKSLLQVPDQPSILYHLSVAYLKKGEKEKARIELQRALATDQEFPEKSDAEAMLAGL